MSTWIDEAARAEFARTHYSHESAHQAALARRARFSVGARPDPGTMCPSEYMRHRREERQRQLNEERRILAIEEAKTAEAEEEKRRKFEEWFSQKNKIYIIQKIVAEHYGFSVQEMLARVRRYDVALARQVAIYLANKLAKRSFPEIGQRFGGRDHKTIIAAVRKIERIYSNVAGDIAAIKSTLEPLLGK